MIQAAVARGDFLRAFSFYHPAPLAAME